ncbi:unnamed protein product [Amoebophrya sp. A25]|nr:unnamed protein product [Amoebophrya sp. A25]|eukprot:GSA25T00018287001.1
MLDLMAHTSLGLHGRSSLEQQKENLESAMAKAIHERDATSIGRMSEAVRDLLNSANLMVAIGAPATIREELVRAALAFDRERIGADDSRNAPFLDRLELARARLVSELREWARLRPYSRLGKLCNERDWDTTPVTDFVSYSKLEPLPSLRGQLTMPGGSSGSSFGQHGNGKTSTQHGTTEPPALSDDLERAPALSSGNVVQASENDLGLELLSLANGLYSSAIMLTDDSRGMNNSAPALGIDLLTPQFLKPGSVCAKVVLQRLLRQGCGYVTQGSKDEYLVTTLDEKSCWCDLQGHHLAEANANSRNRGATTEDETHKRSVSSLANG